MQNLQGIIIVCLMYSMSLSHPKRINFAWLLINKAILIMFLPEAFIYIEHTFSQQNHLISWPVLTFGKNYCYLFSLPLFLRERNVRHEAVGPCKRRGENHISSVTRTEPADTVITNSGNSTGFDGDTSKVLKIIS